jgi:hypothetical protein
MYRLFGGPCNLYLPDAMQKIVFGIHKLQVWSRKRRVKRMQLFT